MKKKIKEDLVKRFWRKWKELDYPDRLKHIKHIYSAIENVVTAKIPKKDKKDLTISMLNSYFEDLYASLRS